MYELALINLEADMKKAVMSDSANWLICPSLSVSLLRVLIYVCVCVCLSVRFHCLALSFHSKKKKKHPPSEKCVGGVFIKNTQH